MSLKEENNTKKLIQSKTIIENTLFEDTCNIIESARSKTYQAINMNLTIRNWQLGERIAKEELYGSNRAKYGKQTIEYLAQKLTDHYGKGFDFSSLYKYVKFYKYFPNILETASPKLLSWSHYAELIRVENPTARQWYAQEAAREVWSVRTLHRNIGTQYYFRLLQSGNKKTIIDEMHRNTANIQIDKLEFIKNPMVAEFLGLQTSYDFTETELERSIIQHMQNFIMEMGKGFAFVARQQHIRTDMGDFFIDLVFYNYILKCFFLIDLKTGQISHQDVGQMDMYVRMYDELKRTDGDNPTIGLLLGSDTSQDMARYSVLHGSEQLFQAKYLTYLPTKEDLAREIEMQKEIFRQQQEERNNL